MAEIRLFATGHSTAGGPDLPLPWYARIKQRSWQDGDSVPVLELSFGSDVVEVWPVELPQLRALAAKLEAAAKELESTS